MIGRALRLIRTFNDITQSKLAAELGISGSFLSELESGKKVPSLDLIYKYAEYFSMPASSILLFSENLEREPGKVKTFLAKLVLGALEKVEGMADGEART